MSGAEVLLQRKRYRARESLNRSHKNQSLPLMFSTTRCARTAIPLSWFSRSRSITMPLRAKIQDPAFSRPASSVSLAVLHSHRATTPTLTPSFPRWPSSQLSPKSNLTTTPMTSSSILSTASAPSSSTDPKNSTPSTAPWPER